MGVIDLSCLDTTPGAPGYVAPPADWRGDADAYDAWLRYEYRRHPGLRQVMWMAERLRRTPGCQVRFIGPYAEVLQSACGKAFDALTQPPSEPTPARKSRGRAAKKQ